MNKSGVFAAFAFLIAFTACQNINDIDIDEGLKKLQKEIPDLESFNKTHLPSADDVENVLRDKCKSTGAENAVDDLKAQAELAKTCIEKYVNLTALQDELEEAKKTGSMDEVFGKYCKRWPDMYDCLDNATITARQCMNKKEEDAFNRTLVIIDDLQEFLCFKDGDRLAMFVAEGGVECLQSRKPELQDCLNKTLGDRIPDNDELSITNLPTFFYSAKDCQDFDTVRVCFNHELEKCKDSTPANIVDAFFKFLKKQMPCGTAVGAEKPKVDASKSGSVTLLSSLVLVTVAAVGRTVL